MLWDQDLSAALNTCHFISLTLQWGVDWEEWVDGPFMEMFVCPPDWPSPALIGFNTSAVHSTFFKGDTPRADTEG